MLKIMDESEIEKNFVYACENKTAQSLKEYIEDCLNTLGKKNLFQKEIPHNKKTYDKLINLLKNKFEYELLNPLYPSFLTAKEFNNRQIEELREYVIILESSKQKFFEAITLKSPQYYSVLEFLAQIITISSLYASRSDRDKYLKNSIVELLRKMIPEIDYLKKVFSFNEFNNFKSFLALHSLDNHFYGKLLDMVIESNTNKDDIKTKIDSLIEYIFVLHKQCIQSVKSKINAVNKKLNHINSLIERLLDKTPNIKETLIYLSVKKETVFNELIEVKSESIPIEYLPFEVFPKGQWNVESIVKHFKNRGQTINYEDKTRLQIIEDKFNPDSCCIGKV